MTQLPQPLTPDELQKIDAYWRAANYLSVGQIYLLDNPLLQTPLTLQHIKPRLLGHWGTTPGLNFIYAHLNRIIRRDDLNMIYIAGPGHGGPALVANTYLEGTYSEHYPDISQDIQGMKHLFRQFSFPGGIGSHATPEIPGSIHEGGELGYALSHAFGAVFDNPDLIAACVVGDGEAETGPLATAWHSNKFLNPVHDGAVLPILHLNGYKIANPTILARISREELDQLFQGYGYQPYIVEGEDPLTMHQLMAGTLDQVLAEIRSIQTRARLDGVTQYPRWPMIILRTPKGWTGRLLAFPSGTALGAGKKTGTYPATRSLAQKLPPGGTIRYSRPAGRTPADTGTTRQSSNGCQPSCQWWITDEAIAYAGFPEICGRNRATWPDRSRIDPDHGQFPAGYHVPESENL